MPNNKLKLDYPADIWKVLILILLICKKEYEKLLANDPGYIKMCQKSGYISDYEKVLPSLIAQIAKNINGDNGILTIELLQAEWEIIYELLTLAFETFGEDALEVEFETEETILVDLPEEIVVPLAQILLDMEPKIFGIRSNHTIIPN